MNVPLLLLSLLPLLSAQSVDLPVLKTPRLVLPARRVYLPPPGSSITPAPYPCVPGSVSVSFNKDVFDSCKGRRKGLLLTVKIDDGCTFQSFKIRFCRFSNVEKPLLATKECVRKKAVFCDSRKRFVKCGFDVVEGCSYGRLVFKGVAV